MLIVTVNNLPTHSLMRWVVVRYDDVNKELWFYASVDDKEIADLSAKELSNGLVVENVTD